MTGDAPLAPASSLYRTHARSTRCKQLTTTYSVTAALQYYCTVLYLPHQTPTPIVAVPPTVAAPRHSSRFTNFHPPLDTLVSANHASRHGSCVFFSRAKRQAHDRCISLYLSLPLALVELNSTPVSDCHCVSTRACPSKHRNAR